MFYSFRADDGLVRSHRLVLFTTVAPSVNDLLDVVQQYCECNSPPDRIELIVPEPHRDIAAEAVSSEKFKQRMPAVSRQLNTPSVNITAFGATGLQPTDSPASLVQQGLITLYQRHNAMLEATASHHYIKPSLRHCSAFLRTGNALIYGPEIEFIATCCLPSLPSGMRRVYCDTGAIHPVAYAILKLLALFNDDRRNSVVTSFGSYRHLNENRFIDAGNSLVLISASTSGELSKQLREIEPRFRPEQIVTLYYLGDTPESENLICNLLYHPELNVDGYPRIQSYSADACPMCRDGSTAVPMSGDHFLPEGVRVSPLLVRSADAPAGLSEFIEPFVGKGILHANYREPQSGGSSKDLFFDLEAAFSSPTFLGIQRWKSRFETVLAHSVSLDTRRIVCLDDPASQHLASQILEYCESKGKSIPRVLANELQQNLDQNTQEGGATLVVASALATGRQLLGVAQTLRYAQLSGAINYAIGLVRCGDRNALRDVRSHLTYGDNGPDEHGFHVIDQYFAPSKRTDKENAWSKELRVLSDLEASTPPTLTLRLSALENSASSNIRGLSDNLFLPSVTGATLRLRPGFAFWNFDYSDKQVSQGDVFATVTLILHALRQGGRGSRSLGQYDHVRRILSPRCFERFNDGVIQASLLRAAYPSEMDYTVNDDVSEEMHDVLHTILSQRDTEVGEAALEFLVALATGQLRLAYTYLKALSDEFAAESDCEIWGFYWRQIQHRILRNAERTS